MGNYRKESLDLICPHCNHEESNVTCGIDCNTFITSCDNCNREFEVEVIVSVVDVFFHKVD